MIKTAVALLMLFISSSYAATLGTVCDSSNTCTTANTYCYQQSACTKGVCVCNGGYTISGAACVPERLIGDSCTGTGVCIAGTCTGGTCQCTSGWTTAGDRRRCIGKSLGQSCSTVADCQGSYEGNPSGVRCNSGTCQCQVGYKEYDSYSCIWHSDGDACTSGTTVCAPGTASCVDSKCTCNTVSSTKYVWAMFTKNSHTFGYCVHPSATQNVGYGQTCTRSDFTASGRLCGNNLVCGQCPENYGTTIYECLNGGEAVKASFILMSIAALLSIIKILN